MGHKSQDERYQYYDYYEYTRPDDSVGESQSYYCELFEKRFGKAASGSISPALAQSPGIS